MSDTNTTITDETLYCATMHIKSFHEQAVKKTVADLGQPCAECKYNKTCKWDWPGKMQPLFDRTGVTVRVCYPTKKPLDKEDSC
jgi:hypothetical protein